MAFKKILKKTFSIQYILVYFGLFTLIITMYYKNKASLLFTSYEKDSIELVILNNTIAMEGGISPSEIDQKCIYLKDKYYPFTYFDFGLEFKLENICRLLVKEVSDDTVEIVKTHDELTAALLDFQNDISEKQALLNFGYDSLLYCSTLLLFVVIMVIIFNSIYQRNQLKTYQLRNDEQMKISRDLHDGVAQDLAALKFYLHKDDKEKTEYYASQAFNEIRYLIGSMHLDFTEDFDSIIKQLLQTFETNYKIKTKLLITSTHFSSLTQDYQLEFLRILQEALSNISRHANATEVTVKFVDVGNNFKFIISDNGTGFNFDEVKENAETETKEHFGLINIQERVRLLGGTVEFANEGGATIAITIKNLIH